MGKERGWHKDVLLIVLTLLLALSMLIGFIGWVRYRDTLKVKLESEKVIGNFFKSIE